ncbi:MAG: DMT family transporter [Bacteroidetes bacterium]|nr:DMT family transporter [Bacteroidota bacterium]
MQKFRLPVYFYGLFAMVFWGMSFIWTTILLKYYPPVTIIFLRLIISSCFLFLVIFLSGRSEQIKRKDMGWILLSALFNPFLYFLGENNGLKFTSPAITSVVIATIPVFSPVVAYLSFREKISFLNIVGIFICFAGLLIMLVNKHLSLEVNPLGLYFLGGAVISALFYSVLLRKLTYSYSAMTLIAWQNLIGVILFMPLFLIYDRENFFKVEMNSEIITSLFLLAIVASSLAFVFYARTVKLLGISKANIFTNLIPVFTAIFSYFILSEVLTKGKITGIIIVIFGVFISEIKKRQG